MPGILDSGPDLGCDTLSERAVDHPVLYGYAAFPVSHTDGSTRQGAHASIAGQGFVAADTALISEPPHPLRNGISP